jgi:hypothetical protein
MSIRGHITAAKQDPSSSKHYNKYARCITGRVKNKAWLRREEMVDHVVFEDFYQAAASSPWSIPAAQGPF